VSGIDVTGPELDRIRAERAHEEGIRALLEVSRTAGLTGSLEDFFGELSSTVARLVGAQAVVFSRLRGSRLVAQPHAYGVPDELLAALSVPCSPGATGLADRIVFEDYVFRAAIDGSPEFKPYRPALDELGVSDAVAVVWRAGDERLGLVAAFDSTRESGFTDEDIHVLKTASMGAGLVLLLRQGQEQLALAQRQESERLQQAAEKTAALERAKSDFLRLASHEMRGPLSVAGGYLSMLQDGTLGEVPAQARKGLDIVRGKIAELDRTVDQILEAARLEDGTLRLQLMLFDVRELIPRAVDNARLIAHPDHTFQLDIGPEPVYVQADRDRVLMVVSNLLDNAVKYSPNGGAIVCTVRRDGDDVAIVVTDQGLGIAETDLPRLFTRFGRVGGEKTLGIPGTGLGLYLCRQAARLHGGDVTMESKLGAGSEFTFVLPATGPDPR
jgi:signal transduction histidine kinase